MKKQDLLKLTREEIEQESNNLLKLLPENLVCENCKACFSCNNCNDCKSCDDCYNCNVCFDCIDCNGCYNCSYCTNQNNKEFKILNVQLTEEEYFEKLKEIA